MKIKLTKGEIMGNTVREKIRVMSCGQTKKISYQRNPQGKIITVIKASRFFGYYCDIKQDAKNKQIIIKRIS